MSKEFKNFIGVINISPEIERDIIKNELESQLEISGGLMYEVSSQFAIGFEFRNHRIYESFLSNQLNQATFIGPTISIETNSFDISLNVMKQIQGAPAYINNLELINHEKYEFRAIIGVDL